MNIYENRRFSFEIETNSSKMLSISETRSNIDYSVYYDEDFCDQKYFYWSSPHLNSVITYEELCSKTWALQKMHLGAAYIYDDPVLQFYSKIVFNNESDPLHNNHLISFENIDININPFCQKVIDSRIPLFCNPLNDDVDRVIFLARYDETIKNILLYTGCNKLSYITLYAYKDWIKSDGIDDKQIASWAGWSNAQLKDFHNTANNPAYLGPFCRHGGKTELPKRPMPLEEAQKGILLALHQFIEYKCNQIELSRLFNQLREP